MKQLSSLHRISVSIILLILTLTAYGGDPYRFSAGAGEAGSGYACLVREGLWSSFHNQALLAYNNSLSIGFNYEDRFSIRELGTRSAAVACAAGKASIGAIYSHFGNIDFKRDMAGLACGMKLSESLYAGVQIDYFSEKTAGGYSNNQSVTFETGLLIITPGKANIGIHLFNPLPNSIRKRYLPAILRVGAGTRFNNLLYAAIEAEMSSDCELVLRTGFEYQADKNFRLRGGFSTDNTSFSFGFGYLAKFTLIDIGFTTHEKLGVTSSVSLIFKIH